MTETEKRYCTHTHDGDDGDEDSFKQVRLLISEAARSFRADAILDVTLDVI